jgi:undecaprenyl pyrophosphate synthase
MWPEFSINDFKIALNDYYQRNRKFGEVTHSKKQLFS